MGFSWDVTLCLVQKTLSSSVFPFSFLQLREAMVAMRKSARDVAKFMDAVSKKTSLQEAQKGVGASRGPLLPKTAILLPCWKAPLTFIDSELLF